MVRRPSTGLRALTTLVAAMALAALATLPVVVQAEFVQTFRGNTIADACNATKVYRTFGLNENSASCRALLSTSAFDTSICANPCYEPFLQSMGWLAEAPCANPGPDSALAKYGAVDFMCKYNHEKGRWCWDIYKDSQGPLWSCTNVERLGCCWKYVLLYYSHAFAFDLSERLHFEAGSINGCNTMRNACSGAAPIGVHAAALALWAAGLVALVRMN